MKYQGKTIKFTDNDFVAQGGEAVIYRINNTAFKIFSSNRVMPPKKLEELRKIRLNNLILPTDFVYEENGNMAGYGMPWSDGIPICKYFSKPNKNLITNLRNSLIEIHKAGCLVVDMNEFNLLVDKTENPVFIDTDSFQTPSYKATAIMDCIRDRKNQISQKSDWFSFAIIAFQIYTNIHPYKGKHPKYRDFIERMNENISVFNKDVSLPPTVKDFNKIPKNHLEWFRNVFDNELREPFPENAENVIYKPKIIKSNDVFDLHEMGKYNEIKDILWIGNIRYVLCKDGIYKEKHHISDKTGDFLLNCEGDVMYSNKDGIYENDVKVGEPVLFTVNGKGFRINSGKLYETTLIRAGKRVLENIKHISNVSVNSLFKGDKCFLQNFWNNWRLILPIGDGTCLNIVSPIKGKAVSASAHNGAAQIIYFNNGKYYKAIYNGDWENFECDLDDINFVVKQNKVMISLISDNIEISFKETKKLIKAQFSNLEGKLYMHNDELYYHTNSTLIRAAVK